MRASIHFEIETAEDFALFGRVFSAAGGFGEGATVVTPAAPAKSVEIEAKPAKPARAAKAEKPVEAKAEVKAEEPAAEKAEEEKAVEAETVDAALVSKEIRAFIAKRGETGAKDAMAVLKQFNATNFNTLKPEDYSKFLSALAQA